MMRRLPLFQRTSPPASVPIGPIIELPDHWLLDRLLFVLQRHRAAESCAWDRFRRLQQFASRSSDLPSSDLRSFQFTVLD